MISSPVKNSSILFLPFSFGSLSSLATDLNATDLWAELECSTDYLLNYAHSIISSRESFRSFEYRETEKLKIYMYEDRLRLSSFPVVEKILISAFGTGIGFVEFHLVYGDLATNEIADFLYKFKKTLPSNAQGLPDDESCLYQVARQLLKCCPEAEMFFHINSKFKYECLCYSILQIRKEDSSKENISRLLYLFRHGYNSQFPFHPSANSSYDTIFTPYENDIWSGCQEGIVNLSYLTGDESADWFANTFKYPQLMNDYKYMYLILLNQRLSAIYNINEISNMRRRREHDLDQLNNRIVNLKTIYSFRVISNDMNYQNVYSRMYDLLDIENFLKDIQDNEEQSQLLSSLESNKTEKRMSMILFALSFLSLSSALIDASCFLDRFGISSYFSTVVSLVSIFLIMIISAVLIYRNVK